MSDAALAWLRAQLDADEQVALEASRFEHDDRPQTPTGEHWQWVDSDDDRVITIDPVTDEYVGESLDVFRVSLRSVEEYPTSNSWTLPHFVINTAEEVPAICGEHIARWDPARVLAEIKAKRAILDEWHKRWNAEDPDYDVRRTDDNWGDALHFAVKALAQPYADRPGFPEEWRA